MNQNNNTKHLGKTVLVCPKAVLSDVPEFILWAEHPKVFEDIRESLMWMDRPIAEKTTQHIQIIPAAYIQNQKGWYCVLERTPSEYSYLHRKLSLISGGHIDQPEPHMREETFENTLLYNLRRELKEELGISPTKPPEILGMIYTRLSDDSSRHAAFMYRAQANQVFTQAPEEFNTESAITGTFAGHQGLTELRERFDPWSKVLIDHLTIN